MIFGDFCRVLEVTCLFCAGFRFLKRRVGVALRNILKPFTLYHTVLFSSFP